MSDDEVSDDGVVDDEVSDGVVDDEVSDGVVDDVTQLASATTTIPSVTAMIANFFICNNPSVDIRRRGPDVYGTLPPMLALWRLR